MKKKRVAAILCILVGSAALHYRGHTPQILEGARQAISLVAYQLLVVQSKLTEPFKRWLHNRRTTYKLEQLLEETTCQQESLLAENIRLKGSLAHLEETEALQKFAARYTKAETRSAQVLARCFSQNEHYFLIDAGSAHGVEPDMAVTHNNTLIGKVSEAYRWYSKVHLITDRTCKIAVYGDKHRSQGIHEGCNDESQTILSYVDHLKPIAVGEMLISSGDGLVFPEGFGVGRIQKSEPGTLYHTITVEPLCDLRNVRYCTVFAKGELRT